MFRFELYMRVPSKILLTAAALCLAWTVYTALQGPFALKRSMPGRVTRFVFCGKCGQTQYLDDLSDELSQPATAAALRCWATEVLRGQRGRKISQDSHDSMRWEDGNGFLTCVEARDIAPPPVLANFKYFFCVRPVTFLQVAVDQVAVDGHVVGVLLSWANLRLGLIVVPGGTVPAFHDVEYEHQVAPDIRVFSIGD